MDKWLWFDSPPAAMWRLLALAELLVLACWLIRLWLLVARLPSPSSVPCRKHPPLLRPWKARLYLALLTWSSLLALCGCGTAPYLGTPLPPVPARLMTPPHPPVPLEPAASSPSSGPITT